MIAIHYKVDRWRRDNDVIMSIHKHGYTLAHTWTRSVEYSYADTLCPSEQTNKRMNEKEATEYNWEQEGEKIRKYRIASLIVVDETTINSWSRLYSSVCRHERICSCLIRINTPQYTLTHSYFWSLFFRILFDTPDFMAGWSAVSIQLDSLTLGRAFFFRSNLLYVYLFIVLSMELPVDWLLARLLSMKTHEYLFSFTVNRFTSFSYRFGATKRATKTGIQTID